MYFFIMIVLMILFLSMKFKVKFPENIMVAKFDIEEVFLKKDS
jgi:hypothetical protein